eukprot:7257892-Prymnesium_polylepis.1
MSGWAFLKGKNKRIGARVIENAELRGLRHLGLDRVGRLSASPSPSPSHFEHAVRRPDAWIG